VCNLCDDLQPTERGLSGPVMNGDRYGISANIGAASLSAHPRTSKRRRRLILTSVALSAALTIGFLIFALNRDRYAGLPASTTVTGSLRYEFVAPQVGWLAESTDRGSIVARTIDGGRSWQKQLVMPGVSQLPTMHFFDDHDGALIGQAGSTPTIWETTDGGTHWQSHPIQLQSPDVVVVASYFLDVHRGWILASGYVVGPGSSTSAVVFQTMDGGVHWKQSGSMDAGTGSYWLGIQFSNAFTGFTTLSTTLPGLPIYITRDGGLTWARLELRPPPAGIFTEDTPTFVSEREGLLVVRVNREVDSPCTTPSAAGLSGPGQTCNAIRRIGQYVYATSDGGFSWTGPQSSIGEGILDVIDMERWVLISGTAFSMTTNGGGTWSGARPIPIPPGWHASQTQFLDSLRGWVSLSIDGDKVGTGGGNRLSTPKSALLKTSDGGSSWVEVSLPIT
jgi:photosystem II stability/assembly factor-like uncharacterized protein